MWLRWFLIYVLNGFKLGNNTPSDWGIQTVTDTPNRAAPKSLSTTVHTAVTVPKCQPLNTRWTHQHPGTVYTLFQDSMALHITIHSAGGCNSQCFGKLKNSVLGKTGEQRDVKHARLWTKQHNALKLFYLKQH